jgi:PadR family transcriptional regulator PadR
MRVDAKTAILQALTTGEGFGLELLARIESRTGGKTRLSEGAIYPALRELERQGLIESFEGETVRERLGRPRIYYRLTGEGRRVAQEEREEARGLFGFAGGPEPALS